MVIPSAYREIEMYFHELREPSPDLYLTDAQAAYLAGVIDGEGTIGIYGDAPSTPGHFHVTLVITNTSETLIDPLRSWIGGAKYGKEPEKPGYRKGWGLVLVQHRACDVIRRCQPYLVIKRPQAGIALEFIASWVSWRGHRRVSDEETERRRSYWTRMRTLNGGKGRPRGPRTKT